MKRRRCTRPVAQETGGFTRDREGSDPEALAVDRVLTRALLAGSACRFLHDALDPLLPAGGATVIHVALNSARRGRPLEVCAGDDVSAAVRTGRR